MPSLRYEGAVYKVRDHESVLDALLRGGADVAFSCRKGSCQSCLLRATEGVLNADSQRNLRPELAETGHFLPCVTHPATDLALERPDLSRLAMNAAVAAKEALAPGVVKLLLEPEINLSWRPGQYVELVREDGLSRPYSIASIAEEDYFLELHVGLLEGGAMSTWVHETLDEGNLIGLRGPMGTCVYDPDSAARPMILVGTSTGMAPLHGILRDALRSGHRGDIHVYFGARSEQGLYLDASFRALAREYPGVHYVPCVSGDESPTGVRAGRASTTAFEDLPEASGHLLYLCGNPEMVHDARYRAILSGIDRRDIFADPFENAGPVEPRDREKLEATGPDPEMWQALDEGAKLREILEDFYEQVYEDPRLSPFFHNVTKDRAIAQQYAFLRDVFTGRQDFFGMRPFNAHHWMIISDDLFDYREDLFEAVARRHGVPEALIRRWSAFHELFRREIVKTRERGMIMQGREYLHEGYSIETLDIGTLCDGCHREMEAGSRGRMHNRTGNLFCMDCGATDAVDQFGSTGVRR